MLNNILLKMLYTIILPLTITISTLGHKTHAPRKTPADKTDAPTRLMPPPRLTSPQDSHPHKTHVGFWLLQDSSTEGLSYSFKFPHLQLVDNVADKVGWN